MERSILFVGAAPVGAGFANALEFDCNNFRTRGTLTPTNRRNSNHLPVSTETKHFRQIRECKASLYAGSTAILISVMGFETLD